MSISAVTGRDSCANRSHGRRSLARCYNNDGFSSSRDDLQRASRRRSAWRQNAQRARGAQNVAKPYKYVLVCSDHAGQPVYATRTSAQHHHQATTPFVRSIRRARASSTRAFSLHGTSVAVVYSEYCNAACRYAFCSFSYGRSQKLFLHPYARQIDLERHERPDCSFLHPSPLISI